MTYSFSGEKHAGKSGSEYTVRRLRSQEIPAALALTWEVFQQFEAPEYSQERIDFFASCNGGIEFEFDALSGLVDITDWDEPPQNRHSVMNASQPENFHRTTSKTVLSRWISSVIRETPSSSASVVVTNNGCFVASCGSIN